MFGTRYTAALAGEGAVCTGDAKREGYALEAGGVAGLAGEGSV